jgi:hypothetical protein
MTGAWALHAAHGGCGLSTVAWLLDPDWQGHVIEARLSDGVLPGTVPGLVCRTDTHGTAAACALAQNWPASAPRPWLFTVPDSPLRPHPAARFFLHAMGDLVAGVVPVPYLPVLRSAPHIGEVSTDPGVRRASALLRARTDEITRHHTDRPTR